jgi:pimeloyl-ACP methyl ester carboxylesterase
MKTNIKNSRRKKPLRITFLTFLLTLIGFLVINSCKKDEEATILTLEPDNNTLVVKNGTNTNGSVLYYDHEIFTRTTGQPNLFTRQIENPLFPYFTNEFVLKICNGSGTNNRVSSAVIKIDGVQIAGPSDFSQNVDSIFKPIPNLSSNSTLEVELRGSQGGFIDLWIEGVYLPSYFTISSEGGEFSFFGDSILLSVPNDAFPSYGLSFLGFTGNEPTSVPNPDLEIVGAPITLQLPATELLKPIQLTYPKPSDDINEENYAVFLFNGTSYFPVEYTIEGNNVIVNIDIINWESNSTKSLLSQIVIVGLLLEQIPPNYAMGLKEISLGNTDELQYNTISTTNSSSKIALFVHGFIGAPSIWNLLIPRMKKDESLPYTHYWTFGYNSGNSISSNGQLLKQLLAASANGAKIDVIAHSMGGLVSRAMIELSDGAGLINRLVTIGTPHEGSPLAAVRYFIGALILIDEPLGIFSYSYNTPGLRDLYSNSSFIEQLTELTNPAITYYTIACRNNEVFWGSPLIEGQDDGIVSVISAFGVSNAGKPDNLVLDEEPGCAHMRMTRNVEIQDQVIGYLKTGSSSGTMGSCSCENSTFCDLFTGSYINPNWNIISGNWNIQSGELYGYWSHSAAQTDQGIILIDQSQYDPNNFYSTVSVMVRTGTQVGGERFVLRFSPGNQILIAFNWNDRSIRPHVRINSSIYSEITAITNFEHYNNTLGSLNEYTIKKVNKQISVYVNGYLATEFVDTYFNGNTVFGLATYGRSYYSDFRICSN